jgi:hypothetical protein
LWITLVLLLFATIGTPNAHADAYTSGTLNFTLTSGGPDATSGSFVYDITTNLFTSFNFGWDGIDYTSAFTAGFISIPSIDQTFYDALFASPGSEVWYGYCAGSSSTGCSEQGFALDVPSSPIGLFGIISAADTQVAFGSVVAGPAVTPEPVTSSLMLIGVGLLGLVIVMRKRAALRAT